MYTDYLFRVEEKLAMARRETQAEVDKKADLIKGWFRFRSFVCCLTYRLVIIGRIVDVITTD